MPAGFDPLLRGCERSILILQLLQQARRKIRFGADGFGVHQSQELVKVRIAAG